MKKKLLSFLTAIILLFSIFSIVGCGETGKQIKILDSNLKDYTIVYAKYAGEAVMLANQTAASYTEWDFNRIIAEELQQKLKDELNITLTVQKDTESEETEKEILIGKTNRVNIKGIATLTLTTIR